MQIQTEPKTETKTEKEVCLVEEFFKQQDKLPYHKQKTTTTIQCTCSKCVRRQPLK